MSYQLVKKMISDNSNEKQAEILQRFFKTKKGEYGEGDIFVGIKVPVLRNIAKQNLDLNFFDLQKLINSKIHEERMVCLFILVQMFKKADEKGKENIYKFYLKNTRKINNWDLVDLSAPNIVGEYLLDEEKDILYVLAISENLWERRIAILSTYSFIKVNIFDDALNISKILLNDSHDLIHKAVGWMLREIGKRNLLVEEVFLKEYYKKMPRTMLRYAIEKFPESKRKKYLSGKI